MGLDSRMGHREHAAFSSGANEIVYDHFAFPGLVVAHYRATQATESVFALPPGTILFIICRSKLPLRWCGRELPPTLLGIARAVREHRVVIPIGWNCYEFTLQEDLVYRTELLPASFLAEATDPDRAIVPLMEPVTGTFLGRMDAIFERCRRAETRPAEAPGCARVYDLVIAGLHEVVEAGLRARKSRTLRSVRRPDLVSGAKEFVSAHVTSSITAEDLAQALGVSYRVLSYALKDSLGVSPYRYVLAHKLAAVRRQLNSSVASVTEACAAHGFEHPSRFARLYARHFGELPSDTRRSASRRLVLSPPSG